MTTAIISGPLVLGASRSVRAIARDASSAPLTSRTPCQDWDLAALVGHLMFYAPVLAASGRRTDPPAGPASEQDIALDDQWPDRLGDALDDVAAAWNDPLAWVDTTTMAGSEPMPAPLIGGMVLGELVVHGWDVARAAGVRPQFADDVLTRAEAAVAQMAELGRGMGIFGPEVPVGPDASVLDRIVAQTGRDPAWSRSSAGTRRRERAVLPTPGAPRG